MENGRLVLTDHGRELYSLAVKLERFRTASASKETLEFITVEIDEVLGFLPLVFPGFHSTWGDQAQGPILPVISQNSLEPQYRRYHFRDRLQQRETSPSEILAPGFGWSLVASVTLLGSDSPTSEEIIRRHPLFLPQSKKGRRDWTSYFKMFLW